MEFSHIYTSTSIKEMGEKMADFKQQPLQEWINENEPGDEYYAKGAALSQLLFLRDQIRFLFAKNYEEVRENPTQVVSTHRSKSVSLPVYRISVSGLELTIRGNFHDWKVSVKSDRPVVANFLSLFRKDERINSVYCEGFREEWVYGSYNENLKQFTVEVRDNYQLYTFLYILSEWWKTA